MYSFLKTIMEFINELNSLVESGKNIDVKDKKYMLMFAIYCK